MAKLCCCWILLLAGLTPAEAQDPAPPELTRLFPPGAQRGQSTLIHMQGKFLADSVRVWSSVPGLTWTKAEGEGKFQVVIEPTVDVGAIFVRLVDTGGVSEVLPFVVGHHPELHEVEPNDRSNQSQIVPQQPIVINGVLQTGGDVDHFQFSLRGGERLVAFLDAERFLKSAVDATLQLVTTDGQILAQNLDYRGLDPQVVWVADRDVDVVLRVFGFPAAPDSTISLGGGEKFLYRLHVTTGAVVEAIAPLTLSEDRSQRFVRHGWNLPLVAESFELPQNRTGKAVTLCWPDAMGHLKVPVVAHSSWLATEVRLPENRLARADESSNALSLPVTITGNLEQARQVDNLLVVAPANKQWRVHLEAADLGYAWDPGVEVLQIGDGKRLHRQDDQGNRLDPDWTWAPSAGVYQLRVCDLHGHGGPHQWYRLSLTEIVPEVSLTVEKTSYRGKAGEVIEIPVAIDRRHGFAADLEFELRASDDASAGNPVVLDPVRSLVGDESAKQVTLKVTSAEVFNGPIRLMARESALPDRAVEIAVGSIELNHVWLTVRPNPPAE